MDVKYWPEIKNPSKYAGKELFFGSVTDPYNPQEETYKRTRTLLEQLKGSYKGDIYAYIKEKYPELWPLYDEIYNKGSRMYWEALDTKIREYAKHQGLEYVRDDDSMKTGFDEPPVIVKFFYHEEIKKSAKKGKKDA